MWKGSGRVMASKADSGPDTSVLSQAGASAADKIFRGSAAKAA